MSDDWLGAMRIKQSEIWNAEGPAFYDKNLRYETGKPKIQTHFRKLAKRVASYTVGAVLDLGCGVAYTAEYIDDRRYVGIDFSPFAVRHATVHCKNPNATFILADVTKMKADRLGTFDTVVAVELLEHVEDPVKVVKLMLKLARKKIVISVPQNMPGQGHVWGTWEPEDIEGLFGELSVCEKFGCWWVAVHETF